MTGEDLPPLSSGELADLWQVLLRGDESDLEVWVDRNSIRARKRERGVVRGLAIIAAPETDRFYGIEIDDDATDAHKLVARLVAATIVDDGDTIEALIETWSAWPAPYRADTVRELVYAILREHGKH